MAIVVKVSNDRMEAIVEADRQTEDPLDLGALKRALSDARVSHGIDEDACNELVTALNQSPPRLKVIRTLAHGTAPLRGEDGSFRLAVEYVRNPVGTLTENGSIDFHDHGPFTPVTQGQLIAEIDLPTLGTPGKDVFGAEIRPDPGQKARISAGAGAKFEAAGTEIRATRNGDLRYTDEEIEVLDVVRVAGNVDYASGNIDCEGPVRIEGDVLAGFHVRAGGDVYIAGVVNSAEVTATGAITIAQGILRSAVSARKAVKTGYVRDAYVESETNIYVAREVLNSTLVSGDTITIADNGRVIGGRLFAQNRIEAGAAGNDRGIPTMLAAGVNPLQELRAAKLAAEINRARTLQSRVGKIKELAQPTNHDVLDQILSRATEKNEQSSDELAKLSQNKDSLTECRIKVRRELHPGVRIRIGSDDLAIEDELRNATFHYDAAAGQVVQLQQGEKR